MNNRAWAKYGGWLVVLASFVISSAGRADLMVTKTNGVSAGITSIVYRSSDNSIGVKWAVTDPTGTNVTAFTFQQSSNLTNWVNAYPTNTVVGVASGEAGGGFATSPKQFYRMQLISPP